MEDFKESVKRSFLACKTDIESLKEENLELKNKSKELKEENLKLKELIFKLDNEKNEFKKKINEHDNLLLELKNELKATTVLINYMNDFNENKTKTNNIQNSINTEKIISEKTISKKEKNLHNDDPYEALLAFKAKTNKREMLKKKLISLISENGINLSELKYMFVDHFRYCSKATFYNYLKELELEKYIRYERENTKNFVYLSHIKKEI
ncbi:hypothetical protein EOM09_03850 [bacterium]|nr:hypothetical protein [bacterium]